MDHIVALADLDKDERENVPHASSASYIIRWIALSKASQGGVKGLNTGSIKRDMSSKMVSLEMSPSFRQRALAAMYKRATSNSCIEFSGIYSRRQR